MSAPSPVIETTALRKRFRRITALDGLDLRVDAGEVHGFLGPNGAGKSTAIRILLGLMRADSGSSRVFGHDPWANSEAVHRRISYVPGDVSLWPSLTGGEVIDLLTSLRGGADRTLSERLVQDFDLDLRRRSRSYSKGNRQKVALIAAFARRADLYILDEPTSGLDPVMESVFRQQVARVRDEGAAVLLSSHILTEVEQLCDRVTIIRAGTAVESGSLAELRHLTRTVFRLTGVTSAGALPTLAGVHSFEQHAEEIRFEVEQHALPAALEAASRLAPAGLTVAPPSLEDLFLHHYESDAGVRS